jgi:hypothetical protein
VSDTAGTKTSTRLLTGARELRQRALRPGGRRPTPRTRRRAIAWAIFAAVLALGALLALDAAFSARHMLAQIKLARDDLINGSTSVVSGDPGGAQPAFQDALDASNAAIDAAGHPGLRLLGGLPIIGNNVAAANAVAHAEQASAEAGLTMTQLAQELNWNTFGLPGVTTLGHVDLPAIRAAAPKMQQVWKTLDAALLGLRDVNTAHLVGPVARGYQEALDTLARRSALAGDAAHLFKVIPPLLGGNGERKYLVAVQSLATPFGAGGRVGPIGVLTANHGVLTLNSLAPADASIADAADSPDVPTDGAAILAAAQTAGLGTLDGVIMVDTVGLQQLLWMSGDVKSTAWPTAISWENAVSTLDGAVFSGTDAVAADVQQSTIASNLMTAVLHRHPSTEAFGTAMGRAVAGRHITIYVVNPNVQQLLGLLGVTGRLVKLDNPVAVTWNTTGTPRTGTLIRRSLSVAVALDQSGAARMHVSVDLENRAPNNPASVLLGLADGDAVGSYAAETSVYLPAKATSVTVETSSPSTTGVSSSYGLPVASGLLTAPSGGSMSMIVSAQVPGAAVKTGSGFVYRLRIVPQAAAVIDRVHVGILLPDTMSVVGMSPGMHLASGKVVFDGTTARPLILTVSYAG